MNIDLDKDKAFDEIFLDESLTGLEKIKKYIEHLMSVHHRYLKTLDENTHNYGYVFDGLYFVEIPKGKFEVSCVEGNDGWYRCFYDIFKHNGYVFNGPFTIKGVIKAMSISIGIHKNIRPLLTEEEKKIFFDNVLTCEEFKNQKECRK